MAAPGKRSRDMTQGTIWKHLVAFALPLMLGNLFQQLYNTVDSIVVGRYVSTQALAAVGSTSSIINMLVGFFMGLSVGAGVIISQRFGAKDDEGVHKAVHTTVAMTLLLGVVFTAIGIFLTPYMLRLMKTPGDVFPEAKAYLQIYFGGVSGLMLYNMGSGILRAVGDSRRPLYFLVFSSVANIVLDLLFVLGLGMGVEGAALATILGQVLSGLMVVRYLGHMKTGPLKREDFRVKKDRVGNMVKIGSAASLNQVAMLLSQIVLNSSLRHYGDLSVYGSSEVLAAAGVVAKVNMIFYSVIIGFSIGCEPIMGFNSGAKNFARVRETYRKTLLFVVVIGAVEFLCFWLFPNQLLSIFGEGTTAYGAFALRYMHIFMFMVAINGVAPVTMNMLSSTGNAKRGTIISLTRQIFLFIPLLLILPLFLNLDGVLYAGPTADFLAMVIALLVVRPELKKMKEAGT